MSKNVKFFLIKKKLGNDETGTADLVLVDRRATSRLPGHVLLKMKLGETKLSKWQMVQNETTI